MMSWILATASGERVNDRVVICDYGADIESCVGKGQYTRSRRVAGIRRTASALCLNA